MLHELEPAQWERVVPLFDAPHLALVARAIACGHGLGRFWTDEPVAPRVALLWDRGRHLYLAGDAATADPATIDDVLRQLILPAMLARECNRYEAHAACEALSALWPQILPDATRRARLLLAPRAAGRLAPSAPIDPALRLRPIDAALLQDDSLAHVRDVRNEVAGMWGSVEAFLRGGFGYCVVCGREIVCWCTAEYVSPGWCGVGIETVREHQRHGLATAAATALLSHCIERGIRMHWDCWADNAPSLRVAEKIGLAPIERFEVACGAVAVLQRRMPPVDA